MLHGSGKLGLNWRFFKYVVWVELLAASALAIFYSVQGQPWRGIQFAALTFGMYAICLWINPIPTFYVALAVTLALLNAAGWTLNFFTRIGPYDEIVHALTTMAITALLGSAVFGPLRPNFGSHRWRFVLTIVSFGLAIGAVWEIVEWCGYEYFAPNAMQGRTDTTSDLVMDLIGASGAALMVLRTSSKHWGETNDADEQLHTQSDFSAEITR